MFSISNYKKAQDRRIRATKSLVFMSLIGIGGGLGGAVQAAQSSPQATDLDEMTVTARRDPEAKNNLIGQVSQVSAEDIQTLGHTHIQELAVRIPGVWLSRGNGQELLAAVRSPVYTGAGSCGEVLIAENGIPIRPSGLCNVNQLFEVNTEQAGALEVWRGAGTVFYGSNAVHGVINSLSPTMNQSYLALETGPHDYYRSKMAWGTVAGAHQWQVDGNGVSDGGLKDDAGYDQQKLTVQHRWQGETLDLHSTLSMVNLNQETAGYITGEKAYDDAGWKDNPNPEAFRDAQAVRLATTLIKQIDEDSSWRFSPYARYSDMRFLQHYLPGQPIEENGQESAGFLLNYQAALNEQWQLWTGVDGEWASMSVQESQAEAFFSPDNARYVGQHYDFEVTSVQLATFVNVEWRWRPEAAVEAGIRWETLSYDYDNQLLDGSTQDDGSACESATGDCRYYRPEDQKNRFSNLSAQLGGRYQLSDQWMVYGRLARAFRAPQINERYRLLTGQGVDQFDEKTIDSVELGLRYHAQTFSAELSGYVMEKQDEVLKASNNATVGDAQTRHRGVELQLGYAISPQWSLAAVAAWSKHTVESASLLNSQDLAGNVMDTAPELLGSLQLRYQPSDPWWFELEAVYMDDYYLDAENEHEYEGHSLLNAMAKYQWTPQWSARLRLHNVTDERYAERGDYAFGSYRYFTGENRAAYLEVRHDF